MGKIVSIRFKQDDKSQEEARRIMEAIRQNERPTFKPLVKPPTQKQLAADALARDEAAQRALDAELGIDFNGTGAA